MNNKTVTGSMAYGHFPHTPYPNPHTPEEIKQEAFAEAMRYMDTAKELLQKAKKSDYYYVDKKNVRISCGAAYHAVLIALDRKKF
jgi:hypothetical protein